MLRVAPSPLVTSPLGTRLASSNLSLSLQPVWANSKPPLRRAPVLVAEANAVKAEAMEPTSVPVAKGELSQGISNDFRAPLLLRPGRECPLGDKLL